MTEQNELGPAHEPPAVAPTVRRPWRAALGSAIIPGLGQLVNREPAKSAAVVAVLVVLAVAAVAEYRFWLLLAAVWSYQVVEAWQTARNAGREGAAESGGERLPGAWPLLLVASVMLAQNLFGYELLRLPVLLPVLFIALGGRLLWTYFRPDRAETP